MSSAFHPQFDGQTEVVNKIITMYLRCLTGDRPQQWLQWLPWAEFCDNSAYQSSLHTSPFRVVFCRDLPSIRSYEPGMMHVPAVAQQLAEHDEFLAEIRDRLEQAQQHYKSYYNKKHRALQFSVRDWVWLRLLNRLVASLDITGCGKLGPCFYGPFKIIERVGDIAYKLEIPAGTKLHSVFHVSLLKPYHGTTPTGPGVLPPTRHGRAIPQPAEVIKGHLAHGVHELLVCWTGQAAANAT
jgi:hypothetical protein